MAIKNRDGTFNHFEMKGGTYEKWLLSIDEVICRAERATDVGVKMDANDINGTCVLTGVISDLTHRLLELRHNMGEYRYCASSDSKK